MVCAASLSLSPATNSYNVGDVFEVKIILNTGLADTDGVDIYYLNYPQSSLEVQGTQITDNSLYPITVTNNASNGKINFSQVVEGGTHYSTDDSEKVLATITFKVITQDTANLYFDFKEGYTDDCNVASDGNDILTLATGANYFLGEEISQSADLDGDDIVGPLDFAQLMINWGSTDRSAADINQDGKVNSVDFGIMMSQWTTS